ncbi:MAG TPA: tripartite tricarboxylate transporter substrate binding protein [Burkholderiales bacterium]
MLIRKFMLLCAALWCSAAAAQGWPSKPITLITAGAPGDGLDVIVRAIGQGLQKATGQNVIVDNRPGAGGRIAMLALKNAPNDGHTIGAISLNNIPLAAVNPDCPYDPIADYTHISLVADAIPMLVVSPGLQVKSVPQLIAYAKANPGQLNFGSSGVGTIFHFYGEWLKQMTGVDMVHVAYKGEALALNDIVNNRIQLMFASGISKPFVQSGKLVLIGTAGPERMRDFPEVPTMREQGLGEFVVTGWIGISGPARLPRDVLDKANAAVAKAVTVEETKKLLNNFTFVEKGSSSEEFTDKIKLDLVRLRKIGQAASIRLE